MLDNLCAEDPSERVVLGRLEIMDSVVLDHREPLRTAQLDHVGVHVDTDCLVAGSNKQLQHLTPSAPDVDDRPATRGGRKESEIALLGVLDILAGAPTTVLELHVVDIRAGASGHAETLDVTAQIL